MTKLPGWLILAACGVGTLGCADLGVTNPPLASIPQQPLYAEECDPSVPCFSRIEDVPADWAPKIYSARPVVYWSGDRAVGSSVMDYFGNRAEEKFTLQITGPSQITRTAGGTSNGSLLPRYNTHTTPGFGLTAPKGSCGHLADLESDHFATTTIWISWQGFNANTVSKSGGHNARQPDCPCSGSGSGPGDEPVLSTTPNFTPSATCSGSGGGGPGAGGGSNLRCYTVTIEHYYYYPDTGEVEYQYSEQYSYCEQIE